MRIESRVWVGLYFCLAWASTVVATGEEVRAFHFDRLNRTYTSFVQDLTSIDLGAVHIDLASPEHSMTLERHTARLQPLGGGSYLAALEIDFYGAGLLEADLLIGAIDSHLSDELTMPQQVVTLEGKIRIDSRSEGYEITLLEIDQKDVAVREVGLALMSISALTLIEICESALGHEGMQGGTPEDVLDLALSTVTSMSKLKRHQLKQTA